MESTFAARAARLQEQLAAPEPETWRPDDPESGHARLLIGELLAVQEGGTVWGRRQIAIIRDGEGQLWNVWLLNKVLIDEFLRQQPKIGDALAIAYDGRIERADAPSYEKYRLLIDQPGQQVSWKAAEGVPSDEPAPEPAPAPVPVAAAPPTPAPQFVPAAAQPQLDEQPPAPAATSPVAQNVCGECGFANGMHHQACSQAIPF